MTYTGTMISQYNTCVVDTKVISQYNTCVVDASKDGLYIANSINTDILGTQI